MNKMEKNKSFSRDYLQSVPKKRKQQMLDLITKKLLTTIEDQAYMGKTSYMIESRAIQHEKHNANLMYVTDEEVLAAIQVKCPDCKVTLQETWIDTGLNTRTLKKGILIDWS